MGKIAAARLKAKFGTTELPMPRKTLRCRPMAVELRGGALAAITYNGVEVLRGISYLVRDENWGTCAAKINGLKIRKDKGALEITYRAKAGNGLAVLAMQAQIQITARQIVFRMRATPSADFKTNRTGFVVLHPIKGAAGRPLSVTHTDGRLERSKFPKLISPGQPFFDIRALEHAPAPGLKAHVLMEGNKFEMEDQRNWSDASFKTYVCSLLDPWPYLLAAGETFEQKITVTISGKARSKPPKANSILRLPRHLPEIGLAVPMAEAAAASSKVEAIKHLNPNHLLCVLDGMGDITSAAQHYAQLAKATGVPISLEIILPAKTTALAEMKTMAQAVAGAGLRPESIVVTQVHDLKSFQPGSVRPWGPSYEEMAAAAGKHFPGVTLGGGMQSFFTELNRKRPPKGLFDFITHSVCPIVHDASDEAVLQTLESLPHIFASAKAFIGKTPYHLGPSTIGARMNPYGADVAHNPKNRRICLAPNDPRQFGTFAVDWNKGLIAAAAQAGIKRMTLSAVTGPQGLLAQGGKPSPLYRYLRSLMS